jgi:hypothetical protein
MNGNGQKRWPVVAGWVVVGCALAGAVTAAVFLVELSR